MGAKSKQILTEIHAKLQVFYGAPARTEEAPFLESVLAALLRQKNSLVKVQEALKHWRKSGPYSAEALLGWSLAEFSERLGLEGKQRTFAKRFRVFLEFLQRQYEGDISRLQAQPSSKLRSELWALPGIGPETADWILLYGLGHGVFAVDVHVYRVFTRHGLVAEEAGYEELQEVAAQFHSEEPAGYREFLELLGRVGKEFCRTLPHCESCPLKGVNW